MHRRFELAGAVVAPICRSIEDVDNFLATALGDAWRAQIRTRADLQAAAE